jgi:hypothetical protein
VKPFWWLFAVSVLLFLFGVRVWFYYSQLTALMIWFLAVFVLIAACAIQPSK